jgi:ABC-type molybdate transport system substrate-binding protein
MAEKKADIFLTYCTNAVLAQKDFQSLKIVRIPANLSVGADYGLLVRNTASTEAWRLAMFILSPEGQKILRAHGFEASAIPQEKK